MVNITGLDNEYFKVNKVKVLKGRSLQELDVDQGNNVVMIINKWKTKYLRMPIQSVKSLK